MSQQTDQARPNPAFAKAWIKQPICKLDGSQLPGTFDTQAGL